MHNAPAEPGDLEPWELKLIENVVSSFLSTRRHSPHLVQEDLAQEALLHWWRQRSRFSSKRGASVQTFLRRVVTARLLDIERELHAEKRGGASVPLSLDAPAGDGNDATLGDSLADERQPEFLIQALHRVMVGLTDRQQQIVQAINNGSTKVDAAKSMGINRDTLYDELGRIQQALRDEGLDEFLK